MLTGGQVFSAGDPPLDDVVEYNKDGWVQNHPRLKVGRYNHACGRFRDSSGKQVGSCSLAEKEVFFQFNTFPGLACYWRKR